MVGEKILFPLLALALLIVCRLGFVDAATSLQPPVKLVWHYYKIRNTCDDAEVYIRHQVKLLWDKDKSITPKLLRLLYSDCFVNVCVCLL
jgi:peroxidase